MDSGLSSVVVEVSSWQDDSGRCIVNELGGEVCIRIRYPGFLDTSR